MHIEEFRKQGHAAIDAICDYYTQLEQLPVRSDVEPGYLVKDLPDHAPEDGESFDVIAADFHSKIMPGITHWQHPNFYAYFAANSNFESILADMYSTAVSNPGFNWACSPACTELEMVATDWAAKLLGLDETFHGASGLGGGIILGSASESCLTAAIAARERCLKMLASPSAGESNFHNGFPHLNAATSEAIAEPQDVPSEETNGTIHESQEELDDDIPHGVRTEWTSKMVMYGSTQTHSLGAKAALILGMQWKALPVSKKDHYALTGATVREALEADKKKGLIPFLLISTIATTSTGAVDHLADIAEVGKDFPTMFIHVDAAWGGVFLSLPELRTTYRLDEVNRYAHSFCTNFHKAGLVAFDCSALFVRDRKLLTSALDVTPAFLRTKHGDTGAVIDYRNWQIALGRRFRSLKLWFVLRSYGVNGFRNHLRNGITLAKQLEQLISSTSNFEIVAPRSLSMVVFRLRPSSSLSPSQLNSINRELNDALSCRSDLTLTQTMLPGEGGEEGVFCIRFAIGAVRTRWEHVEKAWRVVAEEGERVMRDTKG